MMFRLVTPLIFLVLFISNGQSAPSVDLDIDIDEVNKFLAQLLNTTIENIGMIANNFKYVEIEPKHINIFYYQNGKLENTNQSTISKIDFSKPSKIVIHGWMSNGTTDWVQSMTKNFHAANSSDNIFTIDWSYYANKNYLVATTAVQSLGNFVGKFICDHMKNNLEHVHLIGHSLGAQTSGFAGKYIKAKCNGKISRISGLDPAGPLFEFPIFRPPSLQLSKHDAKFVDVIHTNAGFLGVRFPHGAVDFYPNRGGPIQPGCAEDFATVIQIYPPFVCSHGRAYVYFNDTIPDPTKYPAEACFTGGAKIFDLCSGAKKEYMGEDVARKARGIFYLKTDD